MIPRQCIFGLVFVVLIVSMASAALPRNAENTPPPATPGRDSEARVDTVPALPDLPKVHLAPIAGYDDDVAYVRSIGDRASHIALLAEETDDPMRRTEFLLSAANLILARQLEPACSAKLLRLADKDDDPDLAELRSMLDNADALLIRAGTKLDPLSDQSDLPAGWLQESRSRIGTLQAFAMALRAYLLPQKGADAEHVARRAASRLSPLLEDSDRAVAAAAALWQACLRSEQGDSARALSVLDLALVDPVRSSMPHALFARLLRCRLMADRGGQAAALALLMQVEERCSTWLSDDVERDDAGRAAKLMRIQVLIGWYERLDPSGHAAERQWCLERIKSIADEEFDEDSDTVLRLTPAIPMIVPTPDPNAQAPVAPRNGR